MRSTIAVFVLGLAALGLLLSFADSYDAPAGNGRALQLTTDKPEYQRGEMVAFTATNLGSETLVFPGSALGLSIRNLDTGSTYGVIGTAALTPVEPGQSLQVTWQETAEADVGNYVATIHTVAGGSSPSATAEVNFGITGSPR